MSGLSGTMALSEGRTKTNHGHTINSGNRLSTNNNNEDYDQKQNDHNKGDDKKGNHRHTPHTTSKYGIIFEKWTSSQAHKTPDA